MPTSTRVSRSWRTRLSTQAQPRASELAAPALGPQADVTLTAPYVRDVNTVFQDYALFPHMTVVENVEYGLKVKGIRRSDRRERANRMLELVRLPGVGKRKPIQLSGGQRQRVALARALVNSPQVLL